MSRFTPATKREQKLRMVIMGPSGCGKTYTAIQVGAGLLREGERMALIDSEHASAAWYADLAPFDHAELTTFDPREYMAAMDDAAKAGYSVVVIDGLTQAWSGKDGILEQVDRAKGSTGGNQFGAWKDASPLHRRFIDAILIAPFHVVATVRAKTQWALDKNDRGKLEPKNLGMGPEQREGLEFEFDLVAYQDLNHTLTVHKSRLHTAGLDGTEHERPGRDFGVMLLPHLAGMGEWQPPAVDGAAKADYDHLCEALDPLMAEDSPLSEDLIAGLTDACSATRAKWKGRGWLAEWNTGLKERLGNLRAELDRRAALDEALENEGS